jgi:serine/threonine protein phosphatase 1
MATIAVGDVHGNLAALQDILDQLRRECDRRDCVVFLGDYIDRGPDSKGCIEAIRGFRGEGQANVVCLLGNHEDWFLRTLRDYSRHSWLLGMDAWETIRSYSPGAVDTLRAAVGTAGSQLFVGSCRLPYDVFFSAVPADHVLFFESLRLSHQTVDGVFTHGGLNPQIAGLDQQPREALIWGANGFPRGYQGADYLVYGHFDNATLDGTGWPMPVFVGRTIGIDTISHGVLTAIRLPDRRVFQSARHSTRTSDV